MITDLTLGVHKVPREEFDKFAFEEYRRMLGDGQVYFTKDIDLAGKLGITLYCDEPPRDPQGSEHEERGGEPVAAEHRGLTLGAKALVLLHQYLKKFDDESLSSADVKNWLDVEWIPAVRELIDQGGAEKDKIDGQF